ncbi:hypothetical protein PPACK8108_LOCUS5391 [Phakopsora pachyrhizi]|uniref:Uncharacterized protein n=1 Tax=Phakopsora pachyrhizi TaxID=170000 RepID=A0AAV0AQ86_PHAPC|nr:hypothetical protein PPACK8108_LOCUS5391 [Phakopsora pachyrhizi]
MASETLGDYITEKVANIKTRNWSQILEISEAENKRTKERELVDLMTFCLLECFTILYSPLFLRHSSVTPTYPVSTILRIGIMMPNYFSEKTIPQGYSSLVTSLGVVEVVNTQHCGHSNGHVDRGAD